MSLEIAVQHFLKKEPYHSDFWGVHRGSTGIYAISSSTYWLHLVSTTDILSLWVDQGYGTKTREQYNALLRELKLPVQVGVYYFETPWGQYSFGDRNRCNRWIAATTLLNPETYL